MFCRKMAPYGDNHPLLCQIFPDNLTSPAATWYVRLEKTSNWREMANVFLEYYRFNIKIAPGRTVLKMREKKVRNLSTSMPKGGVNCHASASSHNGRCNDQVVHR